MIKENLSVEERIALTMLMEIVRDANVFVQDNNYGCDNMVTTGRTLDLYSLNKSDYEICMKLLNN